jgi:hypothetical protein
MSLSENTQHWLERLRAEVAMISAAERALILEMQVAEVEFAHRLFDEARATLCRCLQRFELLQPGNWTPLVDRAAELCGRLSENRLLEPEVLRGVNWVAQPEIVKYQTALPERVHDIAIQVGRADVAAELVSDAWPGRLANSLVDACRLAAWARDTAELRRVLPLAREAVRAAGPGLEYLSHIINYWLVRVCVLAGLLAEASDLAQASGFPGRATDELVIALWAARDQAAYADVRDGWINNRIEQFRAETKNHHWHSSEVRLCAETICRLGDADGYRNTVRQYREVVAAWAPSMASMACMVNCDLAVMCAKAGETQISGDYFDAAKRVFDGKEPGLSLVRGDRSLLAPVLSAAHRHLGHIDLALRFARRSSHTGERRMSLLFALMAGGRVPDAEAELAKLDSPEERAPLIGDSLLDGFRIGSSSRLIFFAQQLQFAPPNSKDS